MSAGRAPTAMRRPISRVRSVTDTSMMFMMPTPPTISDTRATNSSERVIVSVARAQGVGHFGHVADAEVVGLARLDVVPLVQQVGDLADGERDLLGASWPAPGSGRCW